jgi:hypothetical protein
MKFPACLVILECGRWCCKRYEESSPKVTHPFILKIFKIVERLYHSFIHSFRTILPFFDCPDEIPKT